MQFQFNNFRSYFQSSHHQSWKSISKVGLGFMILGLVLELLKDIIISILSFLSITIGIIILIIAFRVWKLNHFHSNNIHY